MLKFLGSCCLVVHHFVQSCVRPYWEVVCVCVCVYLRERAFMYESVFQFIKIGYHLHWFQHSCADFVLLMQSLKEWEMIIQLNFVSSLIDF